MQNPETKSSGGEGGGFCGPICVSLVILERDSLCTKKHGRDDGSHRLLTVYFDEGSGNICGSQTLNGTGPS